MILLLAAALRFYGLDWDGGLGAHPDERYIVGVAEGLRWPDRVNPLEVAPDFAYGHLFVDDPKIDKDFSDAENQLRGALVGEYDASVDIISASVSFSF